MKPNSKEAVGKGLRSLIKDIDNDFRKPSAFVSKGEVLPEVNTVGQIPLDQIEINPYQPRVEFELLALEELANSIKIHGVIQPLTVRRLHSKKYQLIAGERRMRASKMAGLQTVPCYIRTANDQEMLEIALIENVQREDLNAIEVAITYKRLLDECNLTHEKLSERIGKERSGITNYLRLLKLPPEIQAAIKLKNISMGHARILAGVENPLLQLDIFKQVLKNNLSVRKCEELCRQSTSGKAQSNASKTIKNTNSEAKRIQQNLTSHLSTKVEVVMKNNDRGSITIHYYSKEDLEKLVELLEA